MFRLFNKNKQEASKLANLKGNFGKLDKHQMRKVLGGAGRMPVDNIMARPSAGNTKQTDK